MRFDDALMRVGELGAYQRRQILLLSMVIFTIGVHIMMTIFTLDVPDHRCTVPWLENDSFTSDMSAFADQLQTCTINYNTLRNMTRELNISSTSVYTMFPEHSESDVVNATRCANWVYERSVFTSTIVTQFDLVCNRKLLKSHILMFLMLGQMLGALIGGTAADILGRKKLMIVTLLLQLIVGVLTAWANSVSMLGILYLINGLTISGSGCSSFMLAVEQVGPTWRHVTGIGQNAFWSVGMFWVCFLAYFIRDWRYLQLAVSLPSVLFVLYIWLIPESPRWLAGKGRYGEAEKILHQMAHTNGTQLPPGFHLSSSEPSGKLQKQQSVLSLRRYPKLIVRVLIVLLQWFTCSLTYYGLSLNVGQLSGDIFLNFFLSGVFELAAYLLVIVLLSRVGRKPLYCFMLILGGAGCLLTVVPVWIGGPYKDWAVRGLAMTGKFGIAAAFAIIWLFTPEMFPTSLRVSVTGMSSCSARVGGVAASYLATLTLSGSVGQLLPQIVFGVLAIVAGSLTFTLPETKEVNLPDSMDDALEMKRYAGPIQEKPETAFVQGALLT